MLPIFSLTMVRVLGKGTVVGLFDQFFMFQS